MALNESKCLSRSRGLKLLATIVFVSAFWVPPARAEFFAPNPELAVEARFAQFAILELLDRRIVAKQGIAELLEYRRKNPAYRGDQLEMIHRNVVARSQIKDLLLAKIEPHLRLVNRPSEVDTQVELFHYLMTMAIGYALVDNYVEFVEDVQNDDRLRRIVNEANLGYGKPADLLRDAAREFYSVKFRRPTLRGARRFGELNVDLDQSILNDRDLAFFWAVIENSGTFRFLRDQSQAGRAVFDIGFFLKGIFGGKKIFRDQAHDSLKSTIDGISKAFGNTIGKFQSRRGKLYGSPEVEKRLREDLRPGDILLEKTPFRLTDRFIPGYWGHNAIWLGTEAELITLGIWDHPAFARLQGRIRAGQGVLEALRPGVTTNTLGHFLDVDSYAVIRKRDMGEEELRAVLVRAALQYGKLYDFGFDVETQDRLVCSELMYMTYVSVPYRLERTLGRMTINPDAVAETAVGGPFDIVRLIVDGQWIERNAEAKMASVLAGAFADRDALLAAHSVGPRSGGSASSP